jgi:hypothetical protein
MSSTFCLGPIVLGSIVNMIGGTYVSRRNLTAYEEMLYKMFMLAPKFLSQMVVGMRSAYQLAQITYVYTRSCFTETVIQALIVHSMRGNTQFGIKYDVHIHQQNGNSSPTINCKTYRSVWNKLK